MRPTALSPDLAAIMLMLAILMVCLPASAQSRAWDFRVLLNDSPIGYHRFMLSGEGAEREMKIEARFNVKILFFNAYRYVHDAAERWRGNCLESLTARTDDDGKKLAVDAKRDGERLAVASAQERNALNGCVMSFAYWNPEILRQPRLLNSQTGEYEAVRTVVIGDETITVRGAPVAAKHYRLTGPKNPIDLWYTTGGEWLALESIVEGGRRLQYRLD